MSEIQNDYPRADSGLHLRDNGLLLRDNGLHLRENVLSVRDNGLVRHTNGGEDVRVEDGENGLKLRLTNGHGYDITKLSAPSRLPPVPNGYLQEEVKNYQSNSPSPNLDTHNPTHTQDEPKTRGRRRGSQKARGESWNNEVFDSKADLQLQGNMRESKPYKCTQCTKSFANSSYLSQHTRIHLGIKPYRCEICQRKFTQLSHLQQHIRTHTGDKPYRCKFNTCSKAFSQLSNLQSHSRCHQQDKPFKCNSCYKCFLDENSLLEHIPKHRESKHLKTHICPYCGKSYTQETYLTKHMAKHSERSDKRSPILGLGLNRNEYWKEENITQENIQQHYLTDHHLLNIRERQIKNNEQLNSNNLSDEESIVIRNNSNLINDHMSYEIKNNVVTSNSAFTPINHINYTTNRTYIPYDGLNFQNKTIHLDLPPVSKNNINNSVSFPNNLISLHQIRNYQPASSLLTNEHNLILKDK